MKSSFYKKPPPSPLSRSSKYVGLANEELVALFQAGDRLALSVLVERNQGIVYTLARRQLRRCTTMELGDLAAHGSMGLMRAARDYDPSYPASYCTYASNWIRAYITRAADADTSVLSIRGRSAKSWLAPRYFRWVAYFTECGKNYEEAHEATRKKLGLTSSASQAIRELWVTRGVRSLDAEVHEEGGATLHDTVACEPEASESREEGVDRVAVLRLIRSLRAHLTEREQAVFDGRLFGEETLDEVAKRFGLSRERIRQIEEKLLKRVKVLVLEPKKRAKAMRASRGREAKKVPTPPESGVPAAPESSERLTGTG